jgi:hypothetical protein
MSLEMYAVLYSKYSQASQRFLALLENVPKLQCTLLCIDNRQVRQRVMNNPKLPVQEVPCVIRIFADTGYTELFEGDQAFALVKGLMKDAKEGETVVPIAPQAPPTSPVIVAAPAPEVSNLMGPKLPPQMSIKQHMASVEMQGSPVVPNGAPDTEYIQISKNPVPTFDEVPSIASKPPTGTNSVTTTYLNEIEKENMQRGVPERSLKSNNNGGNLITRAQQMQKEREAEMGMSGPGMRAAS